MLQWQKSGEFADLFGDCIFLKGSLGRKFCQEPPKWSLLALLVAFDFRTLRQPKSAKSRLSVLRDVANAVDGHEESFRNNPGKQAGNRKFSVEKPT